MHSKHKATRIQLLSFSSPQMRAFHMSWAAFFLCFFSWFSVAPLMPVIRKELALTPGQVGWTIIASVAATIVARLGIGWVCDRFGPRRAYQGLLILGAFPVMGVGLAESFEVFLVFRLLIGMVGASFVITQYHTSSMFAPNCVGTANAITAGMGNSGGGATQLAMPLVLAGLMALGFSESVGWRVAMVVPGALMLLMGVFYARVTTDTPEGNLRDLRARGTGSAPPARRRTFLAACRDGRVWVLALAYGVCFGVEITIHNIAALYFTDRFGLGIAAAGAIGGSFGLLAIFARSLGGFLGDRFGWRWGLNGRVTCLFLALFCEGIMLMGFSQTTWLPMAVVMVLLFGMFVHISCGATYAIIPFVNRGAVGSVAGIVGAGGNAGAVLTGFLFTGGLGWSTALLILGAVVTVGSFLILAVRFSPEAEAAVREEIEAGVGHSAVALAPVAA